MPISKVMVAGLTADRQYIDSILSFDRFLKLGKDDSLFVQKGTRGDVGRETIANKFLESNHDALLMLDLDQQFPADTLIKLRSHDKDMVSAHYMKRTSRFLQSIWQYTVDGDWPYLPYLPPDIPKTGMHRIASTGMGCVLIKRSVVEAVKGYLWLDRLGANPFSIGTIPELTPVHTNFGSDYRFFWYAQKLGFELWGDADLDTPHAASIWLTRDTVDDMMATAEKKSEYLMTHVFQNAIRSRGMITLNALIAREQALNDALAISSDKTQRLIIEGQLIECRMWKKELGNSPAPKMVRAWEQQKPKDKPILPTFSTQQEVDYAIAHREEAINGAGPEEAGELRKGVRQREAVDAAKRINMANELRSPAPAASTNRGELVELNGAGS